MSYEFKEKENSIKSILNKAEYFRHMERGTLPQDLEEYRHTLSWPIDITTREFNISYYGEPRFDVNKFVEDEDGNFPKRFITRSEIDIYAPYGTEVKSVLSGNLIKVNKYSQYDPLIDLYIYSEKLDLLFVYAHLDSESLPNKFKNYINKKVSNEVKVTENIKIGEIGDFSENEAQRNIRKILIPESFVRAEAKRKSIRSFHKKSRHHLHFEIHRVGKNDKNEVSKILRFNRLSQRYPQYLEPPESAINPLLLLKKIV